MQRDVRNVFLLEENLTVRKCIDAGNQIERRRLACAIWSDQSNRLAAPDFKRDAVDGDETAEALHARLDRHQLLRFDWRTRWCLRSHRPTPFLTACPAGKCGGERLENLTGCLDINAPNTPDSPCGMKIRNSSRHKP